MTNESCPICGSKKTLHLITDDHKGLIMMAKYCSEACKSVLDKRLAAVREAWEKGGKTD